MQDNKLSKTNRILLIIQMILVIVGLAAQLGIFIFMAINKLDSFMLVSSFTINLSFIAVLVYAIYGYKKNNHYYYIAILLFLLAILINNVLPYRVTTQKILLTLLFGTITGFLIAQDKKEIASSLILSSVILSVGFAIYSSITANPNALGPVEDNILPVIMMYISIFTPVIMSGLFAVTYRVRNEKEK